MDDSRRISEAAKAAEERKRAKGEMARLFDAMRRAHDSSGSVAGALASLGLSVVDRERFDSAMDEAFRRPKKENVRITAAFKVDYELSDGTPGSTTVTGTGRSRARARAQAYRKAAAFRKEYNGSHEVGIRRKSFRLRNGEAEYVKEET